MARLSFTSAVQSCLIACLFGLRVSLGVATTFQSLFGLLLLHEFFFLLNFLFVLILECIQYVN